MYIFVIESLVSESYTNLKQLENINKHSSIEELKKHNIYEFDKSINDILKLNKDIIYIGNKISNVYFLLNCLNKINIYMILNDRKQ